MTKTYGDRWKTIKDIPPGGQGWIYLVEDLAEGYTEPVILKRLQNLKRLKRFKQEVEAALLLDHQNVVKVLASEMEGKEPYFVTPHYKGGNLAEARPWETGEPGRLLDLFGQVCDGAMEAHAKGVIHRDLKPENIFLDSDREKGHAVVGDFGLCLLEDEPRMTTTGEAVGPRHFMAPELEDGFASTVTPKCDVYSLGKLLYWLMSSGNIFSREKHR